MESTGVYHEQIAWYLFQKDFSVSVILPNKAKHYRIGGPTEKLGSQRGRPRGPKMTRLTPED